jgi:feruloyl esterase
VWHGWSDQLIYAQGTIDYYKRVRARMGERTPELLRLFMAPGVAHCGGGLGPAPIGQFESLVKRVEEGVAPGDTGDPRSSVVPIPARRQVQGFGQHRRRS